MGKKEEGSNISSTFPTKLPQQGLPSIKKPKDFPGSAMEEISALNETSRLAPALASFSLNLWSQRGQTMSCTSHAPKIN